MDKRRNGMSLPTGQQRILDGIEEGLRTHDLRLASLFATFTRLNSQEEMPEVEELKPARRRSARPETLRAWRPGQPLPWPTDRPPGRVSWIMLLPIVLMAALSALVLGLLVSAPQSKCAAGVSSFGTGQSISRSGACPVRHAPRAHP
jgi:hypothetical protein